jgi:hypothetical protein
MYLKHCKLVFKIDLGPIESRQTTIDSMCTYNVYIVYISETGANSHVHTELYQVSLLKQRRCMYMYKMHIDYTNAWP